MAEIQGPLTTLNNQLPSGLDATRIAQWMLSEGYSYSMLRSDVAAGLIALNGELMSAWGDMMFITFEQFMEYANGGAVSDMPELTEYDLAELIKGDTIGHMIDLKARGNGIGGTWRTFRDMRKATMLASLRNIVVSGRNTFEKMLLTRALTNTVNTLGTSGYDMPFCNASGTLTYTPPTVGGNAFASTHNHYVGYDSSSKGFGDMLNGIAENLSEHGHQAPFDVKVSETDIASYQALTNFIRPVPTNVVVIDRAGATSGNQFFENNQMETPPDSGAGYYIGSFLTTRGLVKLFATARIPTKYAWGYKSYGINNPRNPVAVRVHPDQGFGFWINEVASDNDKFPVARIQIEVEYGISVGEDRTNGAAGYLVAGGTWANPTIT